MTIPKAARDLLVGRDLRDLFAIITARGWMVNNICQLQPFQWRANLRYVGEDRHGRLTRYFHEFCDAPTVEEALATAIIRMEKIAPLAAAEEDREYPGAVLRLWDNQVVRALLQSELERWLLRELGAIK